MDAGASGSHSGMTSQNGPLASIQKDERNSCRCGLTVTFRYACDACLNDECRSKKSQKKNLENYR